MTGGRNDFVFAYGSLVAERGGDGVLARLAGHRRGLGVAMDNRVDLPSYKWYRDPRDGSRPAVFVAFADLIEDPAEVNGVCVPVDAAALARLDGRERNYERVDVTERLAGPPGRTWAYVGSAEGRARYERGLEAGTAVVTRGYVAAIQAAFRTLGDAEYRAFLASTDFGGVPVIDLERVDR